MAHNFNINLNQSPYFDDYDEDKDFHQILYKAGFPVQARELTQEQSILREQIKRFGNHIFQNGSKVTGADVTINLEYEYVKLQATYNSVTITPADFVGKTVFGTGSGCRAICLNASASDITTGDPDTIFVKYISGESVTTQVQGCAVTAGGIGYTSIPTINITGGGGAGAAAVALVNAQGQVYGVNVTSKGAGYTSAPDLVFTGGNGDGCAAVATLNTAASFVNGERISSADLATSAMAATNEATGRGSAVSIDDGVYFVNGSFVRNSAETLILEKYSDRPTKKVGLTVAETIVDSGDDSTLLDNAQGAYNFSAPGSDRLKIELSLVTKDLTSVDDIDFFEVLRVSNGLIEKDFRKPIYSVLDNTLARRTYDESGNYTVRSFNIQKKEHPTDDTKFTVRIDPGKAFIEGKEYETFTGTDIPVNKAQTYTDVSNFDRLMQYGNYAVITGLKGLFNLSTHQEIDLHNVTSGAVNLTDTSTYAGSKIGTAKVRGIDYVTTGVYNLYIYDIQMSSSGFSAVDSFFIPVDSGTSPVVERSSCNIDNTGRVGGTSGGSTRIFESTDNSLVFKLSQDVIKTIRDDSGVIDTSFQTRRVYENAVFASGQSTISTTGNTETFFGTGVLSDTNKLEGYLVTVKTVGNSAYTVGQVLTMTSAGQSATVNAPGNTSITFVEGTASNFTADIIATVNLDSKQEKVKNLVHSATKTIASPNTVISSYDSLDISDIYKLHAVFDSGDLGTEPIIPSLNLDSPSNDALTIGETIKGEISNATGIVVTSVGGASSLQYIPVTGSFVPEKITGQSSGFEKTVSLVVAGSTNVTSKYELDNGQRDNFYDHGRIKLKSGQIAPVGKLEVVFDYFGHSGNGYLSVDSYTAAIGYGDIGVFTSPITGDAFALRDCVDFRPRRANSATTMENIELPVPNTNWSADYSYYLPRTDTIYLSRIGTTARETLAEDVFGNNEGVPSLRAAAPPRLDGTMDLYFLRIPAYTFKPSDVHVEYIENKRYTMRDISNLEKRLSNVEYYTSLSLLERETESLVIKDANGLDRFKNGIMVDEFSGHAVGDVFSPDYKCSIDFQERFLRPPFTQNLTDIDFDPANSTQITRTGDLISLPYTSETYIDQPLASKFINVNPFAVVAWIGIVDLSPPNDNWIDTNTRPEVVVNLNGENDGWEQMVGFGFESQFNAWQTIGTGRTLRSQTRGTTEDERRGAGQGRALRRQTETLAFQQGNIERAEITGTETVRNEVGERVTDVSIIPFIRPRDITVNVTGMKPMTQIYPFFDGEPVSAYCTPAGGALGDAIYTGESGEITDLVFSIPNTDTLRFTVGDKQFLLLDNAAGDLVLAGTRAEVIYQASGLLQQRENVVISTRVPTIERRTTAEARVSINTTVDFFNPPPPPPRDPLAETFFVDGTIYPNGIFLSSCDIYFKSKDANGIPVTVEIRTTDNGYPSTTVVPFSAISLLPDGIAISEDASVATNFLFDKGLVYLQPGEYSIVVLSNSLEYEVFLAELGDNIIGTTRKVSEQPYVGSFFKSQNASTWTAEQNQDLTFKLNKCKFSVAEFSEALFKNQIIPNEYKSNILQIIPRELLTSGTNINWGVKMTDVATGALDPFFFAVAQMENLNLERQKKITTLSGSYQAAAQFTSSSEHISPIIDLARNSVVTVENIVNNVATNETNTEGGDAFARYQTRRVNLKEGFDATSLRVYLTANRREGTNLKVYYKVLSQFDQEVFDDKSWVEMTEMTNQNNISADDSINEYFEIEYEPPNNSTDYVLNNITYDSFKNFAVKIVMLSSTTTRVPLIKNLRAIALA